MSANDNFSLHDDEELSLHDDASLDGSVPASNKGDAPAKPPQIITTNTLSNIKLPVLQKDDYDTWAMEMEHYLEYIDNEVWKVIQNGNSKKRVTKAPRRNDVYVLDMSSLSLNGACFFAKVSESVNWLWHKRLSYLNFKNINKLAKQNKVLGFPSLLYSKDKPYTTCENGKHHRDSFKTKQNFFIKKCLHLIHMDLFRPEEELSTLNDYVFHRDGSSRKFDAKADDGYFLGYSFVSKAFRFFNTRRQQIEETYHVTFDESMEDIRFTYTLEDEIGIDDSSRYPPDEFVHEDDPSRQYQIETDIS
ncbi:retrovirus-related pol polyprotein from transposon TNT 1-94 [Tanacetum coccineum]